MINLLDLEEVAVAASWTVVDGRLARWQAGFDDDMFVLVAGRLRKRTRVVVPGCTCSGCSRGRAAELLDHRGAGR